MNLEIASPNRQTEAKDHLNQAYSCYEEKEFSQALRECDAAIEIDPSLADAHNLRGIVLEALGRKAEASEAYKQAIQLDPDFSGAKDNLGTLKDELGLFPGWLRDGIGGILIFLAVGYGLELYLAARDYFSTLDRLLFGVLVTLYTPGMIVHSFVGKGGLEEPGFSGIFNWLIRIISGLPFAYAGTAIALRRKNLLLISAITLLLLYVLCGGVWALLFELARGFTL